MFLEEVQDKQYGLSVKPRIVFNSMEFNRLNRYKVDQVRYLLFKDRKYRFGLCIGQKENMFLAPFSAPFASFVSLRSKWEILQLEHAVECFDVFVKEEGIRRVRFALPPSIYDESLMSSLLNVLLRNGYRVAYQDLNFSMGLDFEDMDAYISLLPANGRNKLKCALNENLQL